MTKHRILFITQSVKITTHWNNPFEYYLFWFWHSYTLTRNLFTRILLLSLFCWNLYDWRLLVGPLSRLGRRLLGSLVGLVGRAGLSRLWLGSRLSSCQLPGSAQMVYRAAKQPTLVISQAMQSQVDIICIRGHSTTTYVDRSLPFWTLPPCLDSFYTLSVDKNRLFLPSPPLIIYECIDNKLGIKYSITHCSHAKHYKSISLTSFLQKWLILF